MSSKVLSIAQPEALKLINRQIGKGEALLHKSPSADEEKSKGNPLSQVSEIFTLAFTQWADRTCSMLYKIFENSQYASEFEEIDSNGRETTGLSPAPGREDDPKIHLIRKLNYLKVLADSFDSDENKTKESLESDNSHVRMFFNGSCKTPHLNNDCQKSDYTEKLRQNLSNTMCSSTNDDKLSENTKDHKTAEKNIAAVNSQKVFLVYGKNSRLKNDVISFLKTLDLEPTLWPETISTTAQRSAERDDALSSAFSRAQAMVILMTPDDLVIPTKCFPCEDSETDERPPFSQPGAKALFQAGLFVGYNSQRTVIIQIGLLKTFSDVYEEHVIHLNNSVLQRQEFANRLRRAGCSINTGNSDWLFVGNFQIMPAEQLNNLGLTEEIQYDQPLYDIPDTHGLSKEALQLLTETVQDESCTLSIISGASGLSIFTNGKIFGMGSNKISWDDWNAAFHELLDHGLIEDTGRQEQCFLITHKGCRVADSFFKTPGVLRKKEPKI